MLSEGGADTSYDTLSLPSVGMCTTCADVTSTLSTITGNGDSQGPVSHLPSKEENSDVISTSSCEHAIGLSFHDILLDTCDAVPVSENGSCSDEDDFDVELGDFLIDVMSDVEYDAALLIEDPL